MEMKYLFISITFLLTLTSCTNTDDYATGEIKALQILRETLIERANKTTLFNTRQFITRKKIDNANIPVLFVELENGQNGTLTLFPGVGKGETWLGADGSTITLEQGILKQLEV